MTTEDHIKELKEQGWTRIDTAPGEWVALVPSEDASAFGGTLWKRGDNGNDYSEGCTCGHPISAALDLQTAGLALAAHIKEEIGE
jgi:hypothetical protein